ncbi:unnamed protein product [Vitrella brassicaformis CCMP3155]|uniref:histone acetyltransferase n=1 Tax=Vitrella brassicaformis (strain CCMP3155) TaxID=1169540 RepID=A0A0G4ED89_VITBC|nr:unnamed protein product [Vitrella brassicaformis CCMP3155]|eukprot:CEL93524.1 unnamed protein product [Vitrella brassicaformis CCMP3155]
MQQVVIMSLQPRRSTRSRPQPAEGMGEPSSKKQRLEGRVTRSLRVNALSSVFFHPCGSLDDYRKPPVTFSPSFANHFFDTDQVIMGFEELAVRIYYIPDTFDLFVKVEGESPSFQASRKRVMDRLAMVPFPGGFCPSEHDFVAKLECRTTRGWPFLPPGERVGVLGHTAGAGDEQIEDQRWHVYLAYKRPLTSPGGGDYPSNSRKLRPRASSGPGCLSLCGFATAYTFWSPSTSRRRLRLSQFLIFPHYQRKGVGTEFLQLIYQQTLDDTKVGQMGVEDSAPAFVQLRDVVTVKVAIDRNVVSPLALYPPPPGAEIPSSASAAVPASSGLGLTNGQSQSELPLHWTRSRTRALHNALNDTGASSGGRPPRDSTRRGKRSESDVLPAGLMMPNGVPGASSAAAAASASAASGGMSRRSQKRRRSVGDGMDIDSGVPAVAARDVGMSTRSRKRGRDGGEANSSSAAAAAAAAAAGGGGGGGESHHGTGRSGMTSRGGRGKRSVDRSEGRKKVSQGRWMQRKVDPDAGQPRIDDRYTVHDIPCDGNCLFRSVADQMYGDQDLHGLVRTKCMEYMEANREYFQEFVWGERFEEHVHRMKQDREWGDEVEIQAMSQMYDCRIEIYDASTSELRHQTCSACSPHPMRLSHLSGLHYDSIVLCHGQRPLTTAAPGSVENRAIRRHRRRQGDAMQPHVIPSIDCLALNVKETEQQATRMTEVLQLALARRLTACSTASAYRLSVEERLRKDINEPHPVSKDKEDLPYFRMCHMWNDDRNLTEQQMKKALKDEWEELMQSYYQTIRKLRKLFPPPRHINNKRAADTQLDEGRQRGAKARRKNHQAGDGRKRPRVTAADAAAAHNPADQETTLPAAAAATAADDNEPTHIYNTRSKKRRVT